MVARSAFFSVAKPAILTVPDGRSDLEKNSPEIPDEPKKTPCSMWSRGLKIKT